MNRIEKVREVIDELLLNMDSQDHAHKGAEMARNILDSLTAFTEDEKNLICTAIYNHSDKTIIHKSLDEILKDADVKCFFITIMIKVLDLLKIYQIYLWKKRIECFKK